MYLIIDVNSALHFEAIARLPEWQQRVMRCQVKTVAKGLLKAEREQNMAQNALGSGSGGQAYLARKNHHGVDLMDTSNHSISSLSLKRKLNRKRGHSMMDEDGKDENEYRQHYHCPQSQQPEQCNREGELMSLSHAFSVSASTNSNNPNETTILATSNDVVGNGTATLSTASTMPLVANSKLL